MHFPADRDIGYYARPTAERVVVKQSGGKRYWVWELPGGRANEALDCRVYACGALCGLLYFGLQLYRRADAVEARTPTPDMPALPHRRYPGASPGNGSFVQRLA